MKKMSRVAITAALVVALVVPATMASADSNAVVAAAKKYVANSLSAKAGFTPPALGAKAQKPGAVIGYVASDLSNGGITAVQAGVEQAAKVLGWKIKVYDGQATPSGRAAAMNAAIADKVAAIILGSTDAAEQAATITAANAAGIPCFGWHSAAKPGPGLGLKTNVTTDPLVVARTAASYAIAKSNGAAFGAVIFTDSQYAVAIAKSNAIAKELKKAPGAKVLEIKDTPISTTTTMMPAVIASMLQKYGKKLTYMFGINGAYANGARPALRDAGKSPTGAPYQIAAGDGDSAELDRIRTHQYQAATVAEPVYLQAWQLIDAVNSTFAKTKIANWVAAPGLIDKTNVPKGNVFDPASGYRAVYKKIWGK